MAMNVWALTETEKMACTLLSKLKYRTEEDGFTEYYKCLENDLILKGAKVLLNGRNPIRFIVDVMTGLYGMFNLRTLGDYQSDYIVK